MVAEHVEVWEATVVDPAELAHWRRVCTDRLRAWQCNEEDIAAVQLIVSELTANAFVHGQAKRVDTRVRRETNVLGIEVEHESVSRDRNRKSPAWVSPPAGGQGLPAQGSPRPGGRGLRIVQTLSDSYDVEITDGRRTDRARLVLDQGEPGPIGGPGDPTR